ncbi:hypothetical protein JB92DRAFT_611746 [Gautieria morchelliformis]|nr:hypothetical protein JB92DRAFT_611746 [Gautieria morchelliformis]
MMGPITLILYDADSLYQYGIWLLVVSIYLIKHLVPRAHRCRSLLHLSFPLQYWSKFGLELAK